MILFFYLRRQKKDTHKLKLTAYQNGNIFYNVQQFIEHGTIERRIYISAMTVKLVTKGQSWLQLLVLFRPVALPLRIYFIVVTGA